MNIVASVFGTMKEMYRGLNPAMLTGAIDVIVVQQPDGSFQCSPFHVRFGKLGVLRSKEKVVDIEINGEPVELHMELGDNGEAFFVGENEEVEPEEQHEPVEGSTASLGRRKKRRKKRARSDCPPRDESSSEEQEESESSALQSSKSIYFSMCEELERDHAHSDSEQSPNENVFLSRPSSPKSDSELCVRPRGVSAAEMQWNWGGFPTRSPAHVSSSSAARFGRLERQDSFDLGTAPPGRVTVVRAKTRSLDFNSCSFRPPHPPPSSAASGTGPPHPPPSSAANGTGPPHPPPSSAANGTGPPHPPPSSATNGTGPLHPPFSSVASGTGPLHPPLSSAATETGPPHPPPSCAASGTGPLHPPLSNAASGTGPLHPPLSSAANGTGPPHPLPSSPANGTGPLHPPPLSATNGTGPLHPPPSSPANGTRPPHLPLSSAANGTGPLHPPPSSAASGTGPLHPPPSSPANGTGPLHPPLSSAANGTQSKAAVPDLNSRYSTSSVDKTVSDDAENGQNADCLDGQDEESVGRSDQNGQKGAHVSGEEKEEMLESAANGKETQENKKVLLPCFVEKNSHHQISDQEDLTSTDPEVAVYFPKMGKESSQPAGVHSHSDSLSPQSAGVHSHSDSLSPQSVGSGTLDSGTDYLSDSTSCSADVSLSLCGPGNGSVISKEKFLKRLVTFEEFSDNPGLVDDPNLVVCINSNYYNWAVAGPMVLAMAAFQKSLPKKTVEQLVKDKMSKKSGRWWFPFRRRDDHSQQTSCTEHADAPVRSLPPAVQATLDDVDSDEAAGLGRFASLPSPLSSDALATPPSFSHMYRRSLRLTSTQIEQLNLSDGENSAVFSVTTQYQGTCRCHASIFLWSWDDRVVISDIDGTITKSDALGHLLTTIGADWTHSGIAKLYQRIHQNGYRLLYCSARAIGMSAWTREYLSRVKDRGAALPKGPVLLAPSSLVSALHREVIEKKPEVFKVACLGDIRDLFNPHREPFYAAFGNRTNDAFAYKAVGVPEAKIFTVNPKGELIQEKSRSNKSSYFHLLELVEHFFPSLCSGSEALDCPDFSSATYWKEPLPPLDLDALL